MQKFSKMIIPLLVLATVLISACTGTSAPADTSGGSKLAAAPVEFTGVIESVNGTEWVVNGQTITVDPAVVNDGPFKVGDTVKVEAEVQADGTILVTRVELPSAPVIASETELTPQASSTPAPSSSSATPDPILVNGDNSNSNSNTNTSLDSNNGHENGDSVENNGNDDGDNEDNSDSAGNDDNSGSGGENSNSSGGDN